MKAYRLVVIAVTTCTAVVLSGACSAGIRTASPSKSASPVTGHTGSSPTATPTVSGDTVNVDAPLGTFPIPHQAQVAANMVCQKQVLIELGSITPAQALAFYNSALPRAGYKITNSMLTSDPNTGASQGLAEIQFTGHRYKGDIIGMANLSAGRSAIPGLPGNLAKNVVEISLTPFGAADCNPTAP